MKKIIVVDDDEGIQDIFELIFKKNGYDIQIYPDGESLLQKEIDFADAIILDKRLPGINGLEVCRLLKKQEATRHIPVIMISANPNVDDLAIEAGADEFLSKPFEMKKLLDMVKEYI